MFRIKTEHISERVHVASDDVRQQEWRLKKRIRHYTFYNKISQKTDIYFQQNKFQSVKDQATADHELLKPIYPWG